MTPRASHPLSRRAFLEVTATAGAALVVGCRVSRRGAAVAAGEINAWVHIASDDSVTLVVSESEMGQGVLTSLPMILADELEADWTTVHSAHAPADVAKYGHQSTGGSTSIRQDYATLRQAGAAAREMLVEAAANRWGVDRGACVARNGAVLHVATGRRLTYGALAVEAARLTPPKDPPLKQPSEFRFIGRPVPRLDTAVKVDGSAVYGIDVRVPGMLLAQVVHCPIFGGRVRRFDASKAVAVPGVIRVFEVPTGVAVVARDFWTAKLGRDALEIEWDHGPHADLTSATIRDACLAAIDHGAAARRDGDPERALAGAARRIEAAYETPYLAHAPMEPMNCTADVRPGRCEIWAPTQAQTACQQVASRITGFPTERIHVHTTFVGGGFGRRSQTDFVADAVYVSRAMDRPVKVIWTREDDMRGGWYRPVSYHRLAGGVDASGWPIAWVHRMATPGIVRFMGMRNAPFDESSTDGAANLPYEFPAQLVTCANPDLPISVHWWRSVASSFNAYVTECFLDELAAAGGKDPVALRRRLLAQHPRHRRLLDLVAEKAGWGTRVASGHARGIALHESFGSIAAQVAEVSRAVAGSVRVHRVVAGIDCGQVVNPDTVAAQMESGIAFGLSAALYQEITIEGGATVQGNFDTYPVLRISEMPAVETHIVAQGDALGGIGEVGVPPIAPAVCNALFALEATRVRRLPIGRRS